MRYRINNLNVMKNKRSYALIIIACCLFFNLNSIAQQVSREVAVSAYIYNFAKNIQWQTEDSLNEFHFLIIGQDETIFRELTTLSETKTIRNKAIRVSSSTSLNNIDKAQLIFVAKGNEENLLNIFDRVEG